MKLDAAVAELSKKGKAVIGIYLFKIKSLEPFTKDGIEYFKCELTKVPGKSDIIYSHVKEAKTKEEAIQYALEHIRMMGYDIDR
jgi:hypothetical protein